MGTDNRDDSVPNDAPVVVLDDGGDDPNQDGSAKRIRISGWTVPRPDADVLRRPGDEYLRIEEERVREEKARRDLEKKLGDAAAPPSKGEEAGDGRKKEKGEGKKRDVPVPDWIYAEREILRIEADARDRQG